MKNWIALLLALLTIFLAAAVPFTAGAEGEAGLGRIVTGPAQLTRDYFKPELGSISGALLNCALVSGAFCALMFLPAATITGTTVLGYFLTAGFCFYGIHILNIVPLPCFRPPSRHWSPRCCSAIPPPKRSTA